MIFKTLHLGKLTITKIDALAVEHCPNEKLFGYFAFGQPIYVVNDEELAKRILIKDFDHFMDRRVAQSNEKYLEQFLSNLEGEEWKQMRSLMSGVFTSGKLKDMTKHIIDVGQNFEKFISNMAAEGIEVETKEAGGKMSLDAIATAGFGIDENSFTNPDNQFRIMALTLVGAPGFGSPFRIFKLVFMMALPRLARLLGMTFISAKAVNFFEDILKRQYIQRMDAGVKSNDFISLIIDEIEKKNASPDTKDLEGPGKTVDDTLNIIIANILLFFIAGYETTSLAFTAICHKLALYPEHQEKVHNEILDIIGDSENVTYDNIQSMKYLEMFIWESLRVTHLISSHERKCTKDYSVPGTNFVIPKGRYVKVHISKQNT